MFFISKAIAVPYELVQARKFKGIISTHWNTLVTIGLTSALMVGKVSFCANPGSLTRKHLISGICKDLQFTGSTHTHIKQSPCPKHWTIPSEGSLSYDSQKMSLYFFLCLGVNVFIKVNPNSFCGTKASAPRKQEKPAVREKGTK